MPENTDPEFRPQPAAFASLSIVSHGQIGMVQNLLADVAEHVTVPVEVLLTYNLAEPEIDRGAYPFPMRLLSNPRPRGFGANHNAAFRESQGDCFFVVNPDVRLRSDPFPALIEQLCNDAIGVVAPRVINAAGALEDSARRFPTPASIFLKAIGWRRAGDPDYAIEQSPIDVDWVAGMFMGFRRSVFAEVAGFDEGYFLYYEDVDLCARLRAAGYRIRFDPRATVLHEAQRASHRKLRYFYWHMRSMARYFLTTGRSAARR
ncbi:glycosyltransferase [Methylocaldum sp.]|uniref:glycosyltransferase n=1 Tax=Methylocaldum sp. TaxID=1969727 RepID=UPI00321FC0AA